MVTLGLVFASPVFAISESSILVDVIPENPAPYENVTIDVRSFAANLDSVSISWFVNGKSALSGIGRKTFSINAPASGSEIQMVIRIFLPDGEIEKKVTIRPSQIVLLWQANDSYVPPFYKGKALPTEDSAIKAVAMPEIRVAGIQVSPKNMTYNWKKDYSNVVEASGYGKSFFVYVNDYLEESNSVGVVASTTDQSYSAEATIDVGTVEPKILFYRNDNVLGTTWEKTIENGYRIAGQDVLVAAPYFIGPKDIRRPELVFNWSINDSPLPVSSFRKNSMPLRVEGGVAGTSRLRLDISNQYKFFQTAEKEISVTF